MIILSRHHERKTCIPGVLDIDGRKFPTIEQVDRNNKPYKSCIPSGVYEMVPYNSKKYGFCYVAVNQDLNVYHSKNSPGRPKNGRFKCIYFHRGSYGRNFKGCGGVGENWIEHLQMITNPLQTCLLVNQLIKNEKSFKMRIQHYWD